VALFALAGALSLGAPGCKKTATGPKTVATVNANDGTAMIEVAFAYEPKGDRVMELTVNMRAVGIEEADKIVVQIEVGDFHIHEGVARWTGFVPPRDPKKHVVQLKAVDGNDSPQLDVSVMRSSDSSVLASETMSFRVKGGQVSAAK
jgi:hypothetical protein